MFCVKCGNELADDAQFCGKCGQKINVTENVSAVAVNVEPEAKKDEKKKNIKVIALVAVAVLVLFAFMGRSKSPLAKYKGDYTCVSANAAYLDRYEYQDVAKIHITKNTIEWEGNFNYKEANLDEFEYMGDSGVSWVDGEVFYNDATDEFLPLESYKYYACKEKGIGLVVGNLTGGDFVIIELADWFEEDPMKWAFEMSFQKK